MQNHPVKRHAYLSANSLTLRQDDSFYGFSRRNSKLFAVGLVLLLLVVTLGWRYLAANDTPYELATVSEGDYSFSAQFYKSATLLKSHDMNYLVNKAADGTETSLWVAKIDTALECRANPALEYTPAANIKVQSSCYQKDRLLFVADVSVQDKVYQINMTSNKPVSVQDARSIFSSIAITNN